MYSSEKALVEEFTESLLSENPWSSLVYRTEFDYSRGRTDIIAISEANEVIAIEAKLSKWRNALQQAYRNRCFADKSYVLLPYDAAKKACVHEYEFKRRGVGICSLRDGQITILKEARTDEPIQLWLREQAFCYAQDV